MMALIVTSDGFLSTLSLRRATPCPAFLFYVAVISIHALLAESDPTVPGVPGQRSISIHALLAESDLKRCLIRFSTFHFYPRSPCGERRRAPTPQPMRQQISIHALLAESDCWARSRRQPSSNFYPRSPCGERLSAFTQTPGHWHFYPRSPCGERPDTIRKTQRPYVFLSTLSLRRATRQGDGCGPVPGISIHALLAESDYARLYVSHSSERFLSTLSLRRATSAASGHSQIPADFYPRSPCGERLRVPTIVAVSPVISIHALLAESDHSV